MATEAARNLSSLYPPLVPKPEQPPQAHIRAQSQPTRPKVTGALAAGRGEQAVEVRPGLVIGQLLLLMQPGSCSFRQGPCGEGSRSRAKSGWRQWCCPACSLSSAVLDALQALSAFNFLQIGVRLRSDSGLKTLGFESYSILCLALEKLGSASRVQMSSCAQRR